MKMAAIIQRGLKKDFFDLWFLINIYKWSINNLISMFEQKFKEYNPSIFLKALVYFEDAEKNTDFKEVEQKWPQIKNFLNHLSNLFNFS